MKKIMVVILILLVAGRLQAQDTSKIKSPLTFSGYAEIYYGYDVNHPADHGRPGFVYAYNRTNEVNINLGFIKAAYDNGTVRANLALMAGTYANANLAAEPGVLKNVFEANAGVKLSKSANLWLDAGIFASHIGFESAVGKDCWVLTRNIVSDNTPYYEAGAKISYTTANGAFTVTGLYLNGWQRIQRQDGNNKPAGGLQIIFKPAENITFNYSNYLGTEGADSMGVKRIYHDLYGIFQLSKQFGITAGFDYGTQQTSKGSSKYNHIISPVVIARYKFARQWAVAGRYEYYEDKNGIFIATGTPNGFQTSGYSVNVDYALYANALIRLEGKAYSSKDDVFLKNGSRVGSNGLITASFAISF